MAYNLTHYHLLSLICSWAHSLSSLALSLSLSLCVCVLTESAYRSSKFFPLLEGCALPRWSNIWYHLITNPSLHSSNNNNNRWWRWNNFKHFTFSDFNHTSYFFLTLLTPFVVVVVVQSYPIKQLSPDPDTVWKSSILPHVRLWRSQEEVTRAIRWQARNLLSSSLSFFLSS